MNIIISQISSKATRNSYIRQVISSFDYYYKVLSDLFADSRSNPIEWTRINLYEEHSPEIVYSRLVQIQVLDNQYKQEKADLLAKKLVLVRNAKLRDTDWTMLPDVPMDKKERDMYRKYRGYLRELPELIRLKIVDETGIREYESFKQDGTLITIIENRLKG